VKPKRLIAPDLSAIVRLEEPRHVELKSSICHLSSKPKRFHLSTFTKFSSVFITRIFIATDLFAGAARVNSHLGAVAAQEQNNRQGEGMPPGSVNGLAKERPRQVVLVWDLDETLILFHSLINGDYDAAMGTPPEVRLLPPLPLCGGGWG
jgi:hypothetical protein